MSFDLETKKANNWPIILVHMHPRERIVAGWSNVSGTVYKVTVSHWVDKIIVAGVEYAKEASSSLSSGEWHFDHETFELYINTAGNPASSFVTVQYRKFYSDAPLILPYDLDEGTDVEYEALIKSISSVTNEIDPVDLTGISLTGQGGIKFVKSDHFKEILQGLFWKDTDAFIYLWYPKLKINEKEIIYKGSVEDKSYDKSYVQFKIKDFIGKLDNEVPLELFTADDGDITSEGDCKRRIYGRAKILGVSLDKIKDGFALTGTFSKSGDSQITGTGSSLLSELTPEDTVKFTYENEEYEYTVQTVDSDTVFTVTDEIEWPAENVTLTCEPEIPYRGRNRNYFLASHECREPTTTVESAEQLNRITVVDVSDFGADDMIVVGSAARKIRRVVVDRRQIVLNTNLTAIPSIGTTVRKIPVQSAHYGSKKLVFERDYTVTNSTTLKVTLDPLVEFNLAPGTSTGQDVDFTNGSRVVLGSNLKAIFKPRDWIRNSEDINHTDWYEILSVDSDTQLTLRTAYAGNTDSGTNCDKKSPTYIDDDSLITFDALGKTTGTKTDSWLKTGADVIRDLLLEQGLESLLNEASFTNSSIEAPYTISLALPTGIGGNRPKVKEVVNLINKSVLGSLHTNNNYEIVYNVLTPKKGEITDIYRLDDIKNPKIEIDEKNLKCTIIARYRHEDANIFTGEEGSQTYEYINEFLENISDIESEEEFDLYLYSERDAKIMAHRMSLLRESPTITISAKSNSLFFKKELNQVVYFELDDLFYRQGTSTRNFLGIITKLVKSGSGTEIEVTDLGGFYNKIACIAKTGTNVYASATDLEKANYGFITDSSGILGSDNKTYRLNLIG